MKKHGYEVKEVIVPGLWLDTKGGIHMDVDEALEANGFELTDENRDKICEAFKELIREQSPKSTIVDEFHDP